MSKYLPLAVAALASGCAASPRDEWIQTDTRREIYYALALTADSYTTAQFRRDPDSREGLGIARSVYGSQPEPESVLATAIVGGVAHWLIARRLPRRWRQHWQIGFMAVHGTAAAYNCKAAEIGC